MVASYSSPKQRLHELAWADGCLGWIPPGGRLLAACWPRVGRLLAACWPLVCFLTRARASFILHMMVYRTALWPLLASVGLCWPPSWFLLSLAPLPSLVCCSLPPFLLPFNRIEAQSYSIGTLGLRFYSWFITAACLLLWSNRLPGSLQAGSLQAGSLQAPSRQAPSRLAPKLPPGCHPGSLQQVSSRLPTGRPAWPSSLTRQAGWLGGPSEVPGPLFPSLRVWVRLCVSGFRLCVSGFRLCVSGLRLCVSGLRLCVSGAVSRLRKP